jgi:Sap, sulfolipid-1-addressing protein
MPVQLLLLAVDAALYPTLLAVVAVLLSQPRRRSLLTAYLAGGLTMSIGIGLGVVALLNGSGTVRNERSGVSWITDLSVGAVALLLSAALATRADTRLKERHRSGDTEHAAPGGEPLSQRLLSRGSVPVVFVAALVINLPGAAYLIGLKDIAAGGHDTGAVVTLVVAFNAIMFTLAEVPLAGLVVAPQRTVTLVDRANSWFTANGRRIAVVLSAALGVFLIVRGAAKA